MNESRNVHVILHFIRDVQTVFFPFCRRECGVSFLNNDIKRMKNKRKKEENCHRLDFD